MRSILTILASVASGCWLFVDDRVYKEVSLAEINNGKTNLVIEGDGEYELSLLLKNHSEQDNGYAAIKGALGGACLHINVSEEIIYDGCPEPDMIITTPLMGPRVQFARSIRLEDSDTVSVQFRGLSVPNSESLFFTASPTPWP